MPTVQRGDGHEAITNAAREVFAERGYHAASIRDIAKRAGLSLSALYYWYSSKQDLLTAMIVNSDTEYFARCETALAEAGDDPAARLDAIVRATVEYRVERRLESKITGREISNLTPDASDHIAQSSRKATKMWSDVIDYGISQGAFDCDYPDEARRTIVAACNAIVQWYQPNGKLKTSDLVERYTEIARRVVKAGPSAPEKRR